MRLLVLMALAFAPIAACEAVPAISFVHGLDASAGDDGGDDGSNGDGTIPDGGAGCADVGPAAICCGTVPCIGPDCNATTCGKCEKCVAGEQVCCATNPGNPTCKPIGGGC